MKRDFFYYILLVLGISIMMFAPESMAFEISFESPDEDKSLFYLGQIFGPVGTALPTGVGNALLSNLFSIFNIAVLTLGSIVVSYTIVLSTINTAQEGEVMGRKWSSLWIPIRSAVGIAFLVPTASGYSLLQIMMMTIVVYGIGAANQLWAVVVNTFSSSSGSGFAGKISVSGLSGAADSVLNASICQYVLNTNSACRSSMGNKMVSLYQNSTDKSKFYYGVPGDIAYSEVCGTAVAAAKPDAVLDNSTWYASNLLALDLTGTAFAQAVSEIATGNLPSSINVMERGKNALKGTLSTAPQKMVTLSGANSQALQNGWLFAGSYYWVMISNNNRDLTYPAPTVTSGITTQQGNLGEATSPCRAALSQAITNKGTYITESDAAATAAASASLSLPNVTNNSDISSIMDAIAGPLRSAVNDFMRELTTGDPRGPIPSLARIGTNILNLAEDIWIGVMLASLLILLPACIWSGTNPLCWALGVVFTIVNTVLSIIIGLLWSIGGMIGIYLPLAPYLVFTFTALGWMLLVIETIVAAPIVALGLVSPAGEHLGKAAPAVLLVVNVFLRPSLMILGFIVAAKLVDAVIAMLNYGFFATVEASVGGIGIFGTIALLALYGGTALALIHECFSLIYILPDKIIRWLGGQAEQSQVKQHLAEAKKSVDKGSEIGAGIMKGSAGFAVDKAKDPMGKGEKGEKGDSGDSQGQDQGEGQAGSDGVQSAEGPGTGGAPGGTGG